MEVDCANGHIRQSDRRGDIAHRTSKLRVAGQKHPCPGSIGAGYTTPATRPPYSSRGVVGSLQSLTRKNNNINSLHFCAFFQVLGSFKYMLLRSNLRIYKLTAFDKIFLSLESKGRKCLLDLICRMRGDNSQRELTIRN